MALYEKYGEKFEGPETSYKIVVDGDKYDLYDSYALCCMDGETVGIENCDERGVEVCNVEGFIAANMWFTPEQFEIATNHTYEEVQDWIKELDERSIPEDYPHFSDFDELNDWAYERGGRDELCMRDQCIYITNCYDLYEQQEPMKRLHINGGGFNDNEPFEIVERVNINDFEYDLCALPLWKVRVLNNDNEIFAAYPEEIFSDA